MGTYSKGRGRSAALGLAAMIGLAGVPQHASASPESQKVVEAMTAAGVTFKTTKSDVVWTVPYTSKTHPAFNVIVSTGQNLVVIFAFPMRKAEFSDTYAGLHALLAANHDLDMVKIGIDGDGDIFVRTDQFVDNLTPASLKEAIRQVAASDEELIDKLAPYRVSARK